MQTKGIGDAEDTPLHARVFHAVSLIALIGLPLALFVNFFIMVPWANVALTAAWLLIAALYVISRCFGKLRLSLILFCVGTSILMAFNYLINSGIQGPTLILYLLALVFTLTVMPTRQFLYWMLFNIGIVCGLLIYEFYHADSVQFTYNERSDLFIDTATTYVAVVGCIGAVLFFLIHSYEREKNKALRASQALKAANDSKTRLLSILSHDLRSPFNSLSSYLEMLSEFEVSSEERQSLERSLLDETKSMQVMLYNLLSWTKSQMDDGAGVKLTKLNLSAIVAECMQVQQTAAAIKSISIRTQVDQAIELTADPNMLKLVIQNLLNNAVKFTPSGGEILIFSQHESGSIKLHVADNGIGIPLDRQDNLFTFHATSTYGTNHEKGIGLGLLLCKEYTELQHGRISFSSQQGQGTTFTLEFAG